MKYQQMVNGRPSYGSVSNSNGTGTDKLFVDMEMPSPNSTENASRDNLSNEETYRLLGQSHDSKNGMSLSNSEIQLHSLKGKDLTDDLELGSAHYHRRCRNIVAGAALVSLLFSGVFLLWGLETKNSLIPFPNKNNKATGSRHPPFSTLDPVEDLGLYDFTRPESSMPPSTITKSLANSTKSFPTNAWYQNLIMARGDPQPIHRTYTIPYVVDGAGPIPGLRVHPNHIDASSLVVQLNVIEQYGLTLGAAAASSSSTLKSNELDRTYRVTHATPLGITLAWDAFPMHSSITKGMPYATMRYEHFLGVDNDDDMADLVAPTIWSEIKLAKDPVIDENESMVCTSSGKKATSVLVSSEVELLFYHSDFSWLVFVSEPVFMHCITDDTDTMRLQVIGFGEEPETPRDLIVRVALKTFCTTGANGVNPVYCHLERMHPTALLLGQGNYGEQLRSHAHLFPGPLTAFDYDINENGESAWMLFEWDVQDMTEIALYPVERNDTSSGLLTYALPHHFEIIKQAPPTDVNIYCVASLTGPACLYEGSKWDLIEPIPSIDFRAPRPPAPWAISSLAKSLQGDMEYTLPDFYQRGEGDTYFSGKMLARLGRVLLIADEITELCDPTSDQVNEYHDVCNDLQLPSDSDFTKALHSLKQSVEIWINGKAETPFVFDSAWGGVVSCGCWFDGDKGKCTSHFPECPAFEAPGLNFGNGFYNDHHFHYGYHIMAAAIVAHFDPEWGRKAFERVLLLVRDIANPSEDDEFFPTWRHKDWFSGHSWASGIAQDYLNGKNQESSSEAIAAFEAVALYGKSMITAWQEVGSSKNVEIAREVEKAGMLLTATELRTARMYWHVQEPEDIKIYPAAYKPKTVGMLWQTMAQCQTWFGSALYLAYGIQLLPLTPISEHRDSLRWSKDMYSPFAESCRGDPVCAEQGWYVLELAILATVGHAQEALQSSETIPDDVFESAGGNGHSRSNTLWYFATRPEVENPLRVRDTDFEMPESHKKDQAEAPHVIDCGKPETCTDFVLDTIAGLYSCRQRIDWLMQERAKTEQEACLQVAGVEHPFQCGGCNPDAEVTNAAKERRSKCPPCDFEQCSSELNRCPIYDTTFVCTKGSSRGGCSDGPWEIHSDQCEECCELTDCRQVFAKAKKEAAEANCPPCSQKICRGSINQCPSQLSSQSLCLEGPSKGGCSLEPWALESGQCSECCTLLPGCKD